MSNSLDRFIKAQEGSYETALSELRRGQKTGHWMWYIFPQYRGLGSTYTSRFYAIQSLQEAGDYLRHPLLGECLIECVDTLLMQQGKNAEQIFGNLDAMKFRSCLTLFDQVADEETEFSEALDKYYGGIADGRTLELLGIVTTNGRSTS